MDEAKTKDMSPIFGKPEGWVPQSEADHFIKCPKCGDWIDMRKLEEICFQHAKTRGGPFG